MESIDTDMDIDISLIKELEKGIPFNPQPFRIIGERLGISEDEVISRIKVLKESGVIRMIRARINQRKVGITANALVAWNVLDDRREEAGSILSAIPGVTHCYERRPVKGTWDYSLYTVHHGYDKESVVREIRFCAEKAGIAEYIILFSTKECKRVPCIQISTCEELL